MALLSAAQLTQMRSQATASLDRSCTLRTVTLGASDGAGGFEASTTSDATVACRIATPTARDRVIADRLGVDVDTVITVAHGQAVTETQQVIDQTTSREYQVISSNSDDSYRTATRVLAKRLG